MQRLVVTDEVRPLYGR